MTIIQNLQLQVHSCKVASTDKKTDDLRNYMERTVKPRLGSYAVFLDLINSLPNEHSLRVDEVTVEILEDYRQLGKIFKKAEEYLERHK